MANKDEANAKLDDDQEGRWTTYVEKSAVTRILRDWDKEKRKKKET